MALEVMNWTPAPGTPVTVAQPISFDVLLDVGTDLVITVSYPDTGANETAYDEDGFSKAFASTFGFVGSSKTAIAGGWHFSLRRRSGWYRTPEIKVHAMAGATPPRVSIINDIADTGAGPTYNLYGPIAFFDESNGGNLTAGDKIDVLMTMVAGSDAPIWYNALFFDQTGNGDPLTATRFTHEQGYPAVLLPNTRPTIVGLGSVLTVPSDGPVYIWIGSKTSSGVTDIFRDFRTSTIVTGKPCGGLARGPL